jgi:hypothetical protein
MSKLSTIFGEPGERIHKHYCGIAVADVAMKGTAALVAEVVGLTVGEYQKWYNAQNKEYIAVRQKKYAKDHKNQLQTQYNKTAWKLMLHEENMR